MTANRLPSYSIRTIEKCDVPLASTENHRCPHPWLCRVVIGDPAGISRKKQSVRRGGKMRNVECQPLVGRINGQRVRHMTEPSHSASRLCNFCFAERRICAVLTSGLLISFCADTYPKFGTHAYRAGCVPLDTSHRLCDLPDPLTFTIALIRGGR